MKQEYYLLNATFGDGNAVKCCEIIIIIIIIIIYLLQLGSHPVVVASTFVYTANRVHTKSLNTQETVNTQKTVVINNT
jgi:hypothetical protein